ncbi:unnamed protein product [Prorocentrum cordatum]|uniref:Uncharacterized protein n=1 Tax=Prorocentrum cordatum TaxID=2364126 RepID=A0ABN9TQ18_9DINO|nr:unnamed protein product [Polarella glacialis]
MDGEIGGRATPTVAKVGAGEWAAVKDLDLQAPRSDGTSPGCLPAVSRDAGIEAWVEPAALAMNSGECARNPWEEAGRPPAVANCNCDEGTGRVTVTVGKLYKADGRDGFASEWSIGGCCGPLPKRGLSAKTETKRKRRDSIPQGLHAQAGEPSPQGEVLEPELRGGRRTDGRGAQWGRFQLGVSVIAERRGPLVLRNRGLTPAGRPVAEGIQKAEKPWEEIAGRSCVDMAIRRVVILKEIQGATKTNLADFEGMAWRCFMIAPIVESIAVRLQSARVSSDVPLRRAALLLRAFAAAGLSRTTAQSERRLADVQAKVQEVMKDFEALRRELEAERALSGGLLAERERLRAELAEERQRGLPGAGGASREGQAGLDAAARSGEVLEGGARRDGLDGLWRPRVLAGQGSGDTRVFRQNAFTGRWTLYVSSRGPQKPQQYAPDPSKVRAADQPESTSPAARSAPGARRGARRPCSRSAPTGS